MPGPIPKHSSERIRRNKSDVPIETIPYIGPAVKPPELGLVDPHQLTLDLYNSLAESAQSKYYEPSDWQFARMTLHFMDKQVKSSKPSGQMLATLFTALTELLVSEGSRRRVRIEVDRAQSEAEVTDIAALLRERMEQG